MGKSRNPIIKKINFFFAIIILNLQEISDRMTNQAPANTTSAAGSKEAAREGGKQSKMVTDPPHQAGRCCQSRGPRANCSRKGGSAESPPEHRDAE